MCVDTFIKSKMEVRFKLIQTCKALIKRINLGMIDKNLYPNNIELDKEFKDTFNFEFNFKVEP